jgi:RecB family exonuclease
MAGPALFVTPYGRPAAVLLRERVAAAKAGDPLHPVTILVPTNYVGVSVRRLLATGALGPVTTRGAGVAGLVLLTVYRLAELLGAPALAAAGRRPVSTPLIGAAVRQVLIDAPGIFAPVVAHPSTEQALVRAHRELSALRPASLDTLQRQGRRARDVVRIHRVVRERLAAEWYEEADLMASAQRAVAGSPVLDDLGTVIVYLPEDLSLPAADLIRAVADRGRVEVVAALTGVGQADADVVRSLRRLGLEPPGADATAPPVVDEVVSVSDAEEEVRSAVERVIAGARAGIPLERMAILYPEAEPYARIVHEQLVAVGIAYNGAAVRPLAERLTGRWLLDLLALPSRDYDRPSVMGLLSCAPVVDDRGRWIPAGTWERITRDAGIVRGRGEWWAKLAHYAADQRRRTDTPADDAPQWLIERSRDNAEHAQRLRAFVGGLIRALDEASRMRQWRALAEWCRGMLSRRIERAREHWPQAESDAAERVDAALDRLACLDAVEAHTDLATFRRALQLELEDDLGRVGQLGHGVLVGTPASALGVDLDVVIALGMAEGVAPTRPREDSLLPDPERRVVADELRPRDERVGVEHRHLLAALAGAHTRRILIHPRGDLRRNVERAPSRWLLDGIAARAGPGAPRALPSHAPWLDTVASFAGRMRRAPFPATRQEYGLRELAAVRGGAHLAEHPAVMADPALRRGVELTLQRHGGRFGRFTGRLTGRAAELAAGAAGRRVTSATALEAWLSCPHAYLMQHVLRVKPVENPEELLRIDPLEQGSLVHDVLDRWLSDMLGGRASGSELPAPPAPWPRAARARLLQIAEDACRDAEARGVTGHPLLWRRDRRRLLLDFEQFLARDDQRRRELALTPIGSELAFGMGTDPLHIDLGDGRTVRVRGRIDRVDRAADGTIVVADYKTGGSTRYRDLTADTPLADGTKLQLPIYGLAIRDVHADAPAVRTEYWFVSTKGRWERIGYPLGDATVAQLRDAVRVIADGIASGLFPMRPPAPVWRLWPECDYCDPDGLGTSDHYRAWERIRTDPALDRYVALVEPEQIPAHRLADTRPHPPPA